ncbi:MAG: PTS glucose transporter subunit IIA [Clostridia bacterium]|nr:PTS glucose transporter subunit IIA [Clostridia bacterium]
MKLFSKSQKTNHHLLAVCDGEAVSLEAVPDEAFSSGMLGEGYAIVPKDGTILAPADGVIESVSDSRHAYAISSEIGDLLVHIGIDSVKLPDAFEPLVGKSESVSAGQPIARANLAKLRAAGINTIIPVLITDRRAAGEVKIKCGPVRGGKDTALIIEK